MRVKYVSKRDRKNGGIIWVFNPPETIKAVVHGAEYQQFDTKHAADQHAMTVLDAYDDYKRTQSGTVHIIPDTVNGLIAYYKTTPAYAKLKPNSKRSYILMINTASKFVMDGSNTPFGSLKVSTVTPSHADNLYTQIARDFSKHRATHVCKVLRKVFFAGQRAGKARNNPFSRMSLSNLPDRTVMWEKSDVNRFIAAADKLGMHSVGTLALLGYHLCQRPGDMRQLKWSNISSDGFVSFVQEKTGTMIDVPMSGELKHRIERYRASDSDYVVVCETTGKPFDRRLYSKWAQKVRLAAGLPNELKLSDLRRTGATEMAEAGCTEDELRSVTGHQSRDILKIYVRPTKRMASSGINKRFG